MAEKEKAMKEVFWWRTTLGDEEIRQVTDAMRNEHISQGPVTPLFETEFAKALNVPYAVATTSGTMALTMALMAVGVTKDDEVIVPNRTFIATAHAATILGAKVVLVDTLKNTPLLDVQQVERKITPKTKAIMPVHLNGRSVDMQALAKIARAHKVAIVEDAAQAFYSRNAHGFLGTQSDAGCFSLGMSKLISTGQGGIVVTADKTIYEKLKLIRNHGVVDVFEASYTMPGFNCKFTDIAASIGRVQLKRTHEKVTHVNAVYRQYEAVLGEFDFLKMIPVDLEGGEVPLWVEVLADDRPGLQAFLKERGIGTRRFLPNLNLSPHLGNKGEFPASVVFDQHGLFLPAGPAQPFENVERVIEVLRLYKRR